MLSSLVVGLPCSFVNLHASLRSWLHTYCLSTSYHGSILCQSWNFVLPCLSKTLLTIDLLIQHTTRSVSTFLHRILAINLSLTLVLSISSFLPIWYTVNSSIHSFIGLYLGSWSDSLTNGYIWVGFPQLGSFDQTIPFTFETKLSDSFFLIYVRLSRLTFSCRSFILTITSRYMVELSRLTFSCRCFLPTSYSSVGLFSRPLSLDLCYLFRDHILQILRT